ncbi:hypothetical protein JCM15764A_20620 [Geotalea toluenoxydans]
MLDRGPVAVGINGTGAGNKKNGDKEKSGQRVDPYFTGAEGEAPVNDKVLRHAVDSDKDRSAQTAQGCEAGKKGCQLLGDGSAKAWEKAGNS